jgi:prepilin-type N-terminal cleavage/methylation domain-containing protein
MDAAIGMRPSARRPAESRQGFTLVELIVALAVLSTGILALVATAALLVRQAGTSAAREHAVWLADARFERIAAAGCDAATGGSVRLGAVEETWSVRRTGRALVVVDTLVVRLARQSQRIAFERVLLCDG